jgi:hypothetical protein
MSWGGGVLCFVMVFINTNNSSDDNGVAWTVKQ